MNRTLWILCCLMILSPACKKDELKDSLIKEVIGEHSFHIQSYYWDGNQVVPRSFSFNDLWEVESPSPDKLRFHKRNSYNQFYKTFETEEIRRSGDGFYFTIRPNVCQQPYYPYFHTTYKGFFNFDFKKKKYHGHYNKKERKLRFYLAPDALGEEYEIWESVR